MRACQLEQNDYLRNDSLALDNIMIYSIKDTIGDHTGMHLANMFD